MSEYVENVEDALNQFYKLKEKYEKKILKNKKSIINNKSLSSKEKKIEFQKLKPTCVNCNRPGGSIFTIKAYKNAGPNNDDDYREFRARCDILAQPCNLNITVRIGKYELLNEILLETEKEIKTSKNTIIDDKNKLLFGYITTETTLGKFEEEQQFVTEFSSLLEMYIEKYIDVTNNKQNNMELNHSIKQSYDYITQIKQAISTFNETNNTQFIRDSVNVYVRHLKPILLKIASLKYKEQIVYYNENTNTYHLIQTKNTIQDLEYNSFVNTVIKLDVGLKALKILNKTQEEPIYREVEEDIVNLQGNTFTKEGNTVVWKNPKYIDLWSKLSNKFKQALQTDDNWMVNFMDKCVISKANNKQCSFVAPPNIIMPPTQMPNGEYNFGNKYYNNIFNKQDNNYKQMLLSLYSGKEGTKNRLLETLNLLLEKEFEFNRGFF